MEYAFHVYNKLATDGATMALHRLLDETYTRKKHKRWGDGTRSTPNSTQNKAQNSAQTEHAEMENAPNDTPTPKPPIVVCIGSDLAIGDSLGPITGSMLQYKTQGLNTFIYGTLTAPVTAKEIRTLRTFLRETHRGKQILAIDAAVGDKGDIGLIKLHDTPLLPGAGANKKLGAIGAGSFSVKDKQTRAFDAFALKMSLTVLFPVYIIKVSSSLLTCEMRLILPPTKKAFSSSAKRRI